MMKLDVWEGDDAHEIVGAAIESKFSRTTDGVRYLLACMALFVRQVAPLSAVPDQCVAAADDAEKVARGEDAPAGVDMRALYTERWPFDLLNEGVNIITPESAVRACATDAAWDLSIATIYARQMANDWAAPWVRSEIVSAFGNCNLLKRLHDQWPSADDVRRVLGAQTNW